jgi:UDP-glucose 4-epimerase
VFNLGAEPPLSLKELAELLIKLNASGHSRIVPFPEERRAIDIGNYYADFSKAVRLLGWKPRIAPAEGLKRTVDFYREFGEHYA